MAAQSRLYDLCTSLLTSTLTHQEAGELHVKIQHLLSQPTVKKSNARAVISISWLIKNGVSALL
jgi:hypothetical protein